ncbi:MAG: peptidoglycan DD-metalloendopeptidase family protein [Bacteroidales bacterium]
MHKKIIGMVVLIGSLFAESCSGPRQPETVESIAEDTLSGAYLLDIPTDSLGFEDFRIRQGENLGGILSRFDITPARIDSLRLKAEGVFDVTKMKAGAKYTMLTNLSEGFAEYMIYEKSRRDHIIFDLRDSMRVYEYNKEVTIQPAAASGVITSSLWNAIRDGNNDLALSDKMAEIYAWQIDFFGIGKGDNFKVLYDQAYIDDTTKLEIQDIRGAVFNHLGKEYYAIPFQQDSIVEFFDENGQSLRKAFLKAPLKFSRISSTFSNARRHPILKIVRPHHGVDYAAPVGTPVRSIGDGTVVKKAFQAGGAGYYLKIRHNSSYETTYMHLSKFAQGLKEGKRVAQGEIIGYVGSTGGSTGPHLDFRVHFQGKPINPLKMESPPSLPVRAELTDSFNIVKTRIINELKQMPIQGEPKKIAHAF